MIKLSKTLENIKFYQRKLQYCKNLAKELKPFLTQSQINNIINQIDKDTDYGANELRFWINVSQPLCEKLKITTLGTWYVNVNPILNINIKNIFNKYNLNCHLISVQFRPGKEKTVNSIYSKLSKKDKINLINTLSSSDLEMDFKKFTNQELKAGLLLA